ncbi:UNVERIFIED_CONTAM: Auxin response factor 18 [Sesamum angustifolium]|uniref:Auxin response factor 18 n=1 Tax=Sesamum angustifolium TaxID=2727405 RepID=A0AAW2N4C7_9LAMI
MAKFLCRHSPATTSLGLATPKLSAGMQGARHAQYGLSLSDLHLNKLQSGFFPVGFLPPNRVPLPTGASNPIIPEPGSNENISCLLPHGKFNSRTKKSDNGKAAPFVLFGRTILTEKQISLSCSSDTVSPARTGNSSSGGNANKMGNTSDGSVPALNQNDAPDRSSCDGFQSELNLETGHCKVFMESEDVGRTLDLSLLGSYEELYIKLASMFGTEISEMLNRVLYRDATGAVRQLGDEPFR